MKLHFGPEDSIYKIVQTIKKIPTYKSSTVDIHPDNRLFRHSRRATYLKSIIQEHNLDIEFLAHDKPTAQYRKDANIPHIKKTTTSWRQQLGDMQGLLAKVNTFHKYLFLKKNYLSVAVILSEFVVLVSLLYVFWTLISPNATVIITPAHQLENVVYNFRYYPQADVASHQYQKYLSIPYYTGVINYDYDMSANVQNITYEQEPARGTFVIKNTFPYTYSLLNNTRVVTDEGVIYTFDKRVDVPGGSAERPGTARVRVTAQERFDSGELIGEVGNIPKGKIAYIKNLKESTEEKKIRVEASSQFKYGKTIPIGTVIEEDIKQVEQNILSSIKKEKSKYLKANYQNPDHILLPDEELYVLRMEEFVTKSELGEASSFVEGKVDAEIVFPYVQREDIQDGIEDFLTQRAEDDIHLTSYDKNSLTLYDVVYVDAEGDDPAHFIIPTRLPVIKKYNIASDSLGIISEMKDKIAGLDTTQAEKIVLQYDEIDAVQVKITPRRYNIIPDVKSRIKFTFAQ